MSQSDHKDQPFQQLSFDIKEELKKLTNLIRNKCNYCSCSQKNYLYSFERDNITVFVCSNCIIKLAINDLYEQRTNGSELQKKILKTELKSILTYIQTLIDK